MKPLKELIEEKANGYFFMGIKVTADEYLPVAFKAGWDACLEELSKSAGEFRDDDYLIAEKNHGARATERFDSPNNTYARFDFEQGAKFQYHRDQLIISMQRLRIEELEETVRGLDNHGM